MVDRCAACGAIIPEGQQVCWQCQKGGTMNQEGYKDPTAERAVHNASHIPAAVWEVIRIGRDFFRLAKLDVVEITVEDRKTKRKYSWRR